MKYFISLIFFVLIIIISCSTGYIINMDEQTNYPEGRKLYSLKCNSCHGIHDPAQYSFAQWDSIMVPMQLKAKITDAQKEQILHWIREKSSQLNVVK